MLRKIRRFTSRVIKAAFNRVKTFVVSCFKHTEAIVILTLASMGLNLWLSEVPFYVALPAFVEATMVIPVISVCCILLLLKSADARFVRRNPQLVMA